MPRYRRSLFDRLGPDGPAILRSAVMAIVFSPMGAIAGGVAGSKLGATGWELVLFVLLGWILGALFVYSMMRGLPKLGGAAMQATLMPSGDTTPYETDFSYELALAMRGDLKGALKSFEEKIVARPTDAAVRLKAAEMYRDAGNYERSKELYREVQRIPGVDSRDDVTASYRLIDLYRGKLNDPGRSLPEFRRLIDRYPETQVAQQARDALAKLKKDMSFEGTSTADRSDGATDKI